MNAKKPSIKQTVARRRNSIARQRRILDEGGRQLNMLLEKKPAQALERIQRSTKLPAKQVMAGLLLDAVGHLRETKAMLTAMRPVAAKKRVAAAAKRKTY